MKKSELKVGVEYACVPTSGEARRNWGTKNIFKATLIDVNFTETRWVNGSRAWNDMASKKNVTGIAVDTGSPVAYKVEVGLLDPETKAPLYVSEGGGYRRRKTKSKNVQYDYRILENAGCFLMTWEEHEASLKREQEYKDDAAAKKLAKEQGHLENDEPTRIRVAATLKALADRVGGRVVYETSRYSREENPDRYPDEAHVVIPTGPGLRDDVNRTDKPAGHYVITAKLNYGPAPDGTPCMIGATFKANSLDMARLMGVS